MKTEAKPQRKEQSMPSPNLQVLKQLLKKEKKQPAPDSCQLGADLELAAGPWYSPDEHKQCHRTPTSDKVTLQPLTEENKNKTTLSLNLSTDKNKIAVQTTKMTKRHPFSSIKIGCYFYTTYSFNPY